MKTKETMELDSLGLGVCFLVAVMPDLLCSGQKALKDEWGALKMNQYELGMKKTISTLLGAAIFLTGKKLANPRSS